ncbi:PHD-finger domain-containing protein [Colletotrichum incanum]|nr:PHD-finger domain-containing protein [Colletotrichum incanum]
MLEALAPEAMAVDSETIDEARPVENETQVEMEVIPSSATPQHTAQDAQTAAIDVGPSQPSPAAPAKYESPPVGVEKGKSPTPATSSYKRQFSPATSRYVLSRLHQVSDCKPSSSAPIPLADEPSVTPKAAEEDGLHCPVDLSTLPRTLHLSYATSTVPSAIALGQPPSAASKRKRATEEEGSQRYPNFPAYPEPDILRRSMPKPPVKKKRTKDDGNGHPMCAKCKRASWTDANLIIACSCGEAWHQLCHEPEIPGDSATDPRRFRCSTCKDEEKEQVKYQRQLAKYREAKQEQAEWRKLHNDVERRREKRLAILPEFPNSRIIGFEGGNASREERREYFEDLKKSDLVNLLIFSNDIHPGLLVDILVSISKKHPDLPIFGSPDWAQPRRHQQEAQRPRQNNHARLKAPKQRSKTGGVRKILKTAPAEVAALAADDEDDDDALPESWPKAGHGLYAKLKPEREDPLLFDDNDEEAFSHFMVDKEGKQIMEPLAV